MGALISASSAVVRDEARASVEQYLDSVISANVNTNCSNIQQIVDTTLQGCTIDFATQSCRASFVGDTFLSQETTTEIQQDILKELLLRTEAENRGISFQVLNASFSSTVVQSYSELTQVLAKKLTTDCSRVASGLNSQNMTGVNCFQSTVTFAEQDVDVEVISNCTASAVDTFKSSQDITSFMDITTSARVAGVDITQMIMILAIVGACVVLFGYLFRKNGQRVKENDTSNPYQNSMAEPKNEKDLPGHTLRLLAFVFFIVGIGIFLVFAFFLCPILGVAPYPPRFDARSVDGQIECWENGDLRQDRILNKFMWIDKGCVAKKVVSDLQGIDISDTCEQEDEEVYYANCGLFGGGCDDPEFLTALDNYRQAYRLCNELDVSLSTAKDSSLT